MGRDLDLDDVAAQHPEAKRELERLREDLAAAQADAERYRWLRSLNTKKPLAVVTTGSAWRCTLNTVELDAAIDAALAGERKS